jgi:hypothetical protein
MKIIVKLLIESDDYGEEEFRNEIERLKRFIDSFMRRKYPTIKEGLLAYKRFIYDINHDSRLLDFDMRETNNNRIKL